MENRQRPRGRNAERRSTWLHGAAAIVVGRLTAGLDEEQRDAFEHYLLTKLEADDDSPEDDGQPQLPRKALSPTQRAQYKAHFNAPPKGTADNPLLSVALAKRLAETSPTAKSEFAWNVSLSRFRSLACDGVDLPLRSVTRAHLVKFKDALLKLPSKRSGVLTPQSALKDIGAIKALLGYALAQGWVETNVAAGVSVAKGTVKGKSDRLPYETDEARAILDAATKLPLDGPRGGADRYLPLILAYSGMRLAEASGLRCADVKMLDGVWVFVVENNEERRIKTASSRRNVPIHSALIEAGLLEYVERQRTAGVERVFPTLRANGLNSLGNVFGKFYSRWSRKLVPDRRKTAHSWRHTVATKLRQANVREDLMGELLGWTQTKMASRYGSGHTVAAKQTAVECIAY